MYLEFVVIATTPPPHTHTHTHTQELLVFEVDTDSEVVYFTGIDVRRSVIRVPTDLLRIVGDGTRQVSVISVYYRNMTGLLPGTLPGDEDSVLASPVLSTSLQCGKSICDTSNTDLSLPVIIILPHTCYVKVLKLHHNATFIGIGTMAPGIKNVCCRESVFT